MLRSLLALCLLLCSCGAVVDVPLESTLSMPPVPSAVAPKNETPEARQVRLLRADLAEITGKEASARQRLAAAEKAEQAAERAARLAPVYAAITWATWIGFLVGAAGVALLILLRIWSLPIGTKTAAALAVGGPAVALFAQAFGVALPWLPIVGLCAVGVGLVVGGFLAIRHWRRAHLSLADSYRTTADALAAIDPEAREHLDEMSRSAQVRTGVRHLNDRIFKALPFKE